MRKLRERISALGKGRLPLLLALTALLLLAPACKKFIPPQSAKLPFQNRIQRQIQDDITLSVGVPSREETREIFGDDLYALGIQPVWLKVENGTAKNISVLVSSIDPEYFSPNEAAFKSRGVYSDKAQVKREKFFESMDLFPYVGPSGRESGYVFTRADKGSKYLTVDILTEHDLKRFSYMVQVPGLKIDYYEVDFDKLYQPGEIQNLSLEQLKQKIETFPCCTFSKKGELIGDPVNLVVVGDGEEILSAFVRAGWRETETQKGRAMKVLWSYLNRQRYDYAPMSTLWLFERGQDAGFQKPRETPHERNHFRLWLTPWRYQGQSVWIGAISRDIGLRYTTKSRFMFITHKIDSDVDETREYLLEDLLSVNAVKEVGYVKGVGTVPISDPKLNPMNDPWYSDGLRLVLFLSKDPVDVTDVKVLDWEFPPEREAGPIRSLKLDPQ